MSEVSQKEKYKYCILMHIVTIFDSVKLLSCTSVQVPWKHSCAEFSRGKLYGRVLLGLISVKEKGWECSAACMDKGELEF